jgi:ABC-type Fe3+/spermidine/putrescine transport system ATPase subunit
VLDGGLRLAVAAPAGCADGEAVDVTVRPENVVLLPPSHGPGAHDGAPGTIVDQTFLGNIHEYHVTLSGGPSLRVQTHPGQRLSVGDAARVVIDATACSVFRRV